MIHLVWLALAAVVLALDASLPVRAFFLNLLGLEYYFLFFGHGPAQPPSPGCVSLSSRMVTRRFFSDSGSLG